jgi:peptidoglycan-associated lipoprotein
MSAHSKWSVYCGLAAALGLTLLGCSSSTATKPTVSEASVQAQPTKSKPEIRKAQSATSLEALQRGQSSVTPKENPLQDIYFDFDNYGLRPAARETLKANADWLKKNPAVTVEIEGHWDERGTTEYNLALGAKRANVAKDYPVNLGIPASRLATISYGKEVSVCKEHNEACWQKNRRDRFVARSAKLGV